MDVETFLLDPGLLRDRDFFAVEETEMLLRILYYCRGVTPLDTFDLVLLLDELRSFLC